jgi:chromosome segregation ATPase
MIIDNIKEEVTHDMENLRKKNETETQDTMEGHSSRLEQAKDIISEFEDKMEIQRKTEELLVKQLKSCERNMQELTDSIKRPNQRIIGIEEGEEVQEKRIHNIQQNNNRKYPKSRENYAHSGTGSLQDTKQT